MLSLTWRRLRWVAVACALTVSAAEYPTVANIHYDHYPETVLDVIQPRNPALQDRPAVIAIHGGGWVQGSKEEMKPFAATWVERGMVVVNVDYRLAEVATAPAAVTDVLNALKWVHDHSAEYKIDTNRLIVTGFSAGGAMALLAGMLPPETKFGSVTKVAAVIDFSGITDVAQQVQGPGKRDYAEQWIPAQPGRIELAKQLSPITYARRNLPPILVIHGDADDVVPYQQGVQLVDALKKAGAKADLITVPGGKHEFTDAQGPAIWSQIFKWLKKVKVS